LGESPFGFFTILIGHIRRLPYIRTHSDRNGSIPICGTDPDHKTWAAPKLNVLALNQSLGFLDCLGIVGARQRLKSNEMPINANGVRPVLCHPGLFQTPQFAGKELGDLRGPQRVIAIATETLEFATARFPERFPEQESHGLTAIWTDRRWGVFGHDAHAGSGASTKLTVTD
jgi:hypothetical protein